VKNVRRNIRIAYTFILALLLLLIAVSPQFRRCATAVMTPVSAVFGTVWDGVGGFIQWITPGAPGEMSKEERLTAQVIALEAQLAQYKELSEKYNALRQAANLPLERGWHGIVAEPIARDPHYWNEKITLNRGWKDGAATGALVVDADGAVLGRLLSCERHSSVLVTVLSPECRIGCSIADGAAGGSGVLRGIGEARYALNSYGAILDYLDVGLVVAPGSNIVTSGLGGWLPENMLVGEAVATEDAADNALRIADAIQGQLYCRPIANIRAFRFAVIVVPNN
jgi:rod shape-determining protein MreC